MKCRNCKHNTLREESGEQYSWCEIVHDNLYIDIERECEHYAQATNADRIRSMTDEELAKEFAKIENDPYNGATIGFWLDWLREEADCSSNYKETVSSGENAESPLKKELETAVRNARGARIGGNYMAAMYWEDLAAELLRIMKEEKKNG